MANADETIEAAGLMLNDYGLTNWTKERLFAHLLHAHKQLQVKLLLNGLPVIKKVSPIIVVPAGDLDLDVNQPTDLVEPISVWERSSGSSDGFVEMKEKGWEPETVQANELRYWDWRGELILFVGALSARDVKVKYKAAINVPTQEGDSLGFIFAENYIGPKTAALAALSLGNKTAYAILNGIANENLDEVIRMNVSGQQTLPARRRPYRRARRRFRTY